MLMRSVFFSLSSVLSPPLGPPPAQQRHEGEGRLTIDNHFCLLPVTIPFKGQPLRAKDPLPCPGLKSFHEASTHLKRLCSFLQTPCPNVHSFITPSQFPESGDLRTMVLTIAETLSKVAIVRVADKGAAMLWGFCAPWVWDNVDRFLTSENYTPLPLSSSNAVKGNLSSAIQAHHWPLNKNASIPLLYILAKAKSLSKQMIVWRPIAAVVQPFILRHWLRLAARAFTLFLKTLVSESLGTTGHLPVHHPDPTHMHTSLHVHLHHSNGHQHKRTGRLWRSYHTCPTQRAH